LLKLIAVVLGTPIIEAMIKATINSKKKDDKPGPDVHGNKSPRPKAYLNSLLAHMTRPTSWISEGFL
jgi:hypothetical protein